MKTWTIKIQGSLGPISLYLVQNEAGLWVTQKPDQFNGTLTWIHTKFPDKASYINARNRETGREAIKVVSLRRGVSEDIRRFLRRYGWLLVSPLSWEGMPLTGTKAVRMPAS
jgi:hypothetical protein